MCIVVKDDTGTLRRKLSLVETHLLSVFGLDRVPLTLHGSEFIVFVSIRWSNCRLKTTTKRNEK